MDDAAIKWITGPNTGASSKALWAVMMGHPAGNSYPSDGGDLWRCLNLLEQVPEWKSRIGEMRDVSPYWAALVDRWDDLVALMFKELGPDLKLGNSTPETYSLMKAILRPIEDKDRNLIRLGDGMSLRFK